MQTILVEITEPRQTSSATQIEASSKIQYLEPETATAIIPKPQHIIMKSIITEPTTRSAEVPSSIYVNRKRVRILVKEGKELAKRNKSMKGWLLQKTNPLQLSSVQEEDEAMEVDEMSMRELNVEVDHAKGQRLAKCKA